MLETNSLLDLWEYRCEHYTSRGLDRIFLKCRDNIIKKYKDSNNQDDKNFVALVSHARSEEEFFTQILRILFDRNEQLLSNFFEKIKFNPSGKITIEAERQDGDNRYDLAFLDENEKLICIIENKLNAPFDHKQLDYYYEALNKGNDTILVTLTKFNIEDDGQFKDLIKNVNLTKEIKSLKVVPNSESKVKYYPMYWSEFMELAKDSKLNDDFLNQAMDVFKAMKLDYKRFQEPFSSEKRSNYIDTIKKDIIEIIEEYKDEFELESNGENDSNSLCNFIISPKNAKKIKGNGRDQYKKLPSINFEICGYFFNRAKDVYLEFKSGILVLDNDKKLYTSPRLYDIFKKFNTTIDKEKAWEELLPENNLQIDTVSYPGNVDSEEEFYKEVKKRIKLAIEKFKGKIGG